MPKLIFISGPCGCGKSTFAGAYAGHLAGRSGQPVCLIHGDDLRPGAVEPEEESVFSADGKPSDTVQWEDILRSIWNCIIETAGRALGRGRDVVIDYVIEDELPRVRALAEQYGAEFYYIVLTAEAEELKRRIRFRGDVEMIGRALFLKQKLETLPENRGHLYDNTHKSPEDMISKIVLAEYRVNRP